uniref:hypothetical protein n=1 Tax=Rhodococcus oryzae TaxID=2571143 RepID=UPI001B7FB85A|nr:hypothetical protein [Rhodococcus oryzae]
MRGGDRLFVSPDVADYLGDLRELGVSERQLCLERDGWILMQTASPEDAAVRLAEKRELITDPDFRVVYLEHDAAYDRSPNDPRLPALAHRTAPGTGSPTTTADPRPAPSTTRPSRGWRHCPSPEPLPRRGTASPNS